jgi:hypothetical protein
MRVLIVIVQILVTLVLTASVMPIILVTVPAAREERLGLTLMAGVMIIVFVLVSLVWPARRRRT